MSLSKSSPFKSSEQATATAVGVPPTPRPLLAEAQGAKCAPCETAGQASGFRPALGESVGPFSTGQEWATWTPDFGRTASRLPESIWEVSVNVEFASNFIPLRVYLFTM